HPQLRRGAELLRVGDRRLAREREEGEVLFHRRQHRTLERLAGVAQRGVGVAQQPRRLERVLVRLLVRLQRTAQHPPHRVGESGSQASRCPLSCPTVVAWAATSTSWPRLFDNRPTVFGEASNNRCQFNASVGTESAAKSTPPCSAPRRSAARSSPSDA